jgi:hypothetical protein
VEDISGRIAEAVGSWDGVTSVAHSRGGIQFLLGRRELGHVHPGGAADLPFPRRVRDELVAAGRAVEHPFARDTGWVRRTLAGPDDEAAAIELFRLSYERAVAAAQRGS